MLVLFLNEKRIYVENQILIELVGVGETTHTTHNSENVVVDSV